MREKTKPIWIVPAVVIIFLYGCASPVIKGQPPPAPTISSETRAKIEQEAVRIMEEEKETFELLAVRMDEYQNTMALCESLSQENQDSRIGVICREKLTKLKNEIEYLSGLLRRDR